MTVKQCEMDRRHGASVQAERAGTYFDIDIEQPDMHFACPVRIEYVERLPNVTGADGMCRVQTVRRQENARYYDLLTEVEKLTGMPVVLNTSLNEKDRPIAETPYDAIDLLIRGDLAALYLDGVLVIKEPFHHVQPKGFSS
jgi:carbamoyltransferase